MGKLSNWRILVLAYEEADATELTGLLAGAGAEAVVTATAREALGRLQQFEFDAAVIDCCAGFKDVAAKLADLRVPYCVFVGEPLTAMGKARPAMRMEQLVSVLEELTGAG